MDKRKVITAYQRGFITIQECSQILGIENVHLSRLIQEAINNCDTDDIVNQPING
ncbi:MAG TPA: hypothetical protein VGI33_06470 [Paenibacillus sp.]